jgi:NAD(P)-dependent dehydrogenase (short-subunit alcohol dehydrogenase family)
MSTPDWQVAIVTGGASGIGAALGAALVRRGCMVLLADIDDVGVQRAAERISRIGPGRAVGSVVDVCDPEQVSEAVQRAVADNGRLDLLFNNAGIAIGGYTQELSLAHWQRTIDIDLYGVVHGVRAAYPVMLRQGYGHIVNTASLAGVAPAPGLLPYTTAKFGVVGLSLGLRAEAARRGVRVSVVVPGVIDTPILGKKQQQGLRLTPSGERMDPISFTLHMTGSRDLYPADRFAQDVLRGVAANKAVIAAPVAARSLWRISRLFPGLVEAMAIRRFERERTGWDDGRPAQAHREAAIGAEHPKDSASASA